MKICELCGQAAPFWSPDLDGSVICMPCAQRRVRQELQKIRAEMDNREREAGNQVPDRLYCDYCEMPISDQRAKCPHCGAGGLG